MIPPEPSIWRCLTNYWALDRKLARHWWLALYQARHATAAAWHQALLLFEQTQIPYRNVDLIADFINTVTSPQTAIEVLEALHAAPRLTRKESNRIMDGTSLRPKR